MKNQISFVQRHPVLSAFIALLIIFIFIRLITHFHQHREDKNKVAVEAVPVRVQAMPIILQTSGIIEPVQSVDVRSQITGTITKIDFTPGQNVTAGQVLFEINPASYEAALEQTQAVLARDLAQLKSTQLDEQRFKVLAEKGFVSKQDYDHLIANEAMQKATVEADQDAVKTAQIQLQYTQIQAPINGQTGNVSVKVGDLLTAASADPLVTINQINPVLVTFSLPQNKLSKLLAYQSKAPINVEVWSESGHHQLGNGTLVFIDNNINAQTGTVLLKARVDNTQKVLWPGLMTMVKIILATQANAKIVPSQAIQVDQAGQFVYVIKNGRAEIVRVTVNRQVGNLSVITQGLAPNDQVITVMPPDLANDTPVKIAK